jgi:hypothetical protein
MRRLRAPIGGKVEPDPARPVYPKSVNWFGRLSYPTKVEFRHSLRQF